MCSSSELLGDSDRVYQLECGHVFFVDSLDQYFNQIGDGAQKIEYKRCPTCNRPVFVAPRYSNIIKKSVNKMESLKQKLQAQRQQINEQERREVIAAVSAGMGSARGHWFECPNGHVFAIGECGGAMQVGNCADCGERIGGTSHTLLATNNLATSIEGNDQPAWPTALNR
jgi:DNA-directed RNA polymerase subunit RPC12/RpoP